MAMLACLIAASAALGRAGSLDPGFSGNGQLTTTFGGQRAILNDVARADGEVVAAGTSRQGGGCSFALSRYRRDGGLDRSFGERGKVLTNFGIAPSECAGSTAVATAPDGTTVAGGTVNIPNNFRDSWLALARYRPDGTLDPSFSEDGVVTSELLRGVSALAVQSDGRVVVAVHPERADGTRRIALARFNPDGSLDGSFGDTGIAEAPQVDLNSTATDIALGPDGRIVAAGVSDTGTDCGTDEDQPCNQKFAVARFEPNGQVDGSFGNGGIVATPVGFKGSGQNEATAYSVAVRGDGRVLVGGDAWVHGCGYDGCEGTNPDIDLAVARYTREGRLDRSFARGGIALTDVDRGRLGLADDGRGDVIPLSRGRTLLVGSAGDPKLGFTMVRYERDGRLDRSFARDGMLVSRVEAFAKGATTVPGRRLVVGGEKTGQKAFVLARFRIG